MDFKQRIELHYHLKNQSHSMNAVVRNRCEAEALSIFLEIAKALNFDLVVESSAYSEGGLREFWDFLGRSNNQLTLLIALVAIIFSRVPMSDSEMDALNKEIAKLTIEEKKLVIEKLKKESEDGRVSSETLSQGVTVLESSIKVAARRSNFYKSLVEYSKVTGVGISPISADEKEIYIDRSEFGKFVLATNKLPIEVVETAFIEIVAPVLKEGNYQWKGLYQGEPISFAMTDEEFKISVLSKQVSFQYGSAIECVLNIHRKFDAVGDVAITGYSVPTVLGIADGVTSMETPQGKRHRAKKKFSADQQHLF